LNIQPLGEQIIIRTIPQDQVGSILIPDTAKGITQMGSKGESDAVHFVEAEVISVGPGKRQKGDPFLVNDLALALDILNRQSGVFEPHIVDVAALLKRARDRQTRLAPLVKPGDKILYHPAVQKFDREITHLMNGDAPVSFDKCGKPLPGSKYFIIREESVLAVIER